MAATRLKCPFCRAEYVSVVDSRVVRGGQEIRRRRICGTDENPGCGRRFTTFERMTGRLEVVVKKDGRRVPYDREKVKSGILRATWKTRMQDQDIVDFLNKLESDLSDIQDKQVTTTEIGRRVLEFLKEKEQVAYVRFASVYSNFETIDQFKELLGRLKEDPS